MYVNGITDVYKTDLYEDVIAYISKAANIVYDENKELTKSMRIIADHMRTTVMLIGDINGILPSNVGAGYILRRIMRRAIRHAKKIGLNFDILIEIAKIYIEDVYAEAYPLLVEKKDYIIESVNEDMRDKLKVYLLGWQQEGYGLNPSGNKISSKLGGKKEFKELNSFFKNNNIDSIIKYLTSLFFIKTPLIFIILI